VASLDDYAKSERAIQNAKKAKNEHPKGWEPGLNTAKKEIISKPQKKAGNPADHKWDVYLRDLGFDPEQFEIIEPFEIRSWDSNTANGKDTFFYYKAKIISKNAINDKDFDFKALLKEIKSKKVKPQKIVGDDSFVVCLSDWQMGKRDGDGTKGIVERIEQMIPDVKARYKLLRKQGVELSNLYVFGLGDIVEGCEGFYDMQTFTVEYDLRRQKMIARRLLVKALTEWAPDFKNVVVACVPGNHGENRNQKGKAFTTFGDNFDVSLFDEAQEILAMNNAYKHVKFVIPENDLWLTLDVSGTIVGLAHGHQFRTGGRYAHQKAVNWLSGQAFGMTEMGDSDILISGHFHHLFVVNEGKRTLMQCPSLDGGSDWFENITGKSSFAGTLTFSITDGKTQLPWDNLKVI
jgi:predicted phosphodiesterase